MNSPKTMNHFGEIVSTNSSYFTTPSLNIKHQKRECVHFLYNTLHTIIVLFLKCDRNEIGMKYQEKYIKQYC